MLEVGYGGLKLYKVVVVIVRRVLRIDSEVAILEQECDKTVLLRSTRWEAVVSRWLIARWTGELRQGAERMCSEA